MEPQRCKIAQCDQSFMPHRWGRARSQGWFIQWGGTDAWCPKHIPGWVADWRARKSKENQHA